LPAAGVTAAPALGSDEELVRQAAAGDRLAFERLVLRYQDRVFNMLARMCGSTELAEDLAQEAFLRSWRGLNQFQQGSRFYTWLYRIALNIGFSSRRQEAHRRSREGASLEAFADDQRPADPALDAARQANADPARQAENRQTRERVRKGLNQLDQDYRRILVLRDVDGLDYDAIAETLSLSRPAVKSRLHRARRELARVLKDLKPGG
jgi:RNA polymerase sigma-70 factor, ECF subfamily